MSEEIKNPGMELNEAEISGVSGESYYSMSKAKDYYQSCDARGNTSGLHYCVGGVAALAEFLERGDIYYRCPYLREGTNPGKPGSVG